MLTLVDGPSVTPVDLEDFKLHAHVDFDDEDAAIVNYIATATACLDGRDGLLGRALITQTWKLTIDRFYPKIPLPLWPVQSVESISYVDASGLEQTLNNFRLYGVDDDPYVAPAVGEQWPATSSQPESVSVTFKAGYGDDPEDVPEPLREAIRLWASHLYENREATTADPASAIPLGVDQHIADYRRFAF